MFARIDIAAAALVLAPLLAAAAVLIAEPGKAHRQAAYSPASSRAEQTAVATLNGTDGKSVDLPTVPQPLSAVLSEPLGLAEPIIEVLTDLQQPDLIPSITEESELLGGRERRCEIADLPVAPDALAPTLTNATPAEFGLALAEAALTQTKEFVVYTDSYKRMSFPDGDVSALFGVCTDVVVRAYRVLGLDLQYLVQRARIGRGDPNLDHRRTEILRRFFAAHGGAIAPSDIIEDYLPGDVISYHRPQNSGFQAHIAIVSNIIGVSGRPLIVHNRGWGPQLEDALFVDRITGHYRYWGQSRRTQAAGRAAAPGLKSLTKRRLAVQRQSKPPTDLRTTAAGSTTEPGP